MNKDFTKGLYKASIIYLAGIVLTVLVHWIVGWDYPHAPPASFLVVVIFMFYAPFNTFNCISKIISETEIDYNKGSLIIQGAFTAFFLISFLYFRYGI